MNNKKAFLSIALIMLTEVLGWSLILPFLPYFAKEFGATPLQVGIILSTFSIFQFFSAPIIGKLSDKYGRKKLLILSQISTMIGFIILAFSDSIEMIFLSRAIDGILGSNMALALAYISDISKDKERTKFYTYATFIQGAGLLIGPLVGGLLATVSYALPALLAATISFISVILSIFTLKETVKLKKIKGDITELFPLKEFLTGITQKGMKKFFVELFLFVTAYNIIVANFSLFADYQLGIGPGDVGILFVTGGAIFALFQLIVAPFLIERMSERAMGILGTILTIISMYFTYFAKTIPALNGAIVIFAIGTGLLRPALLSILTEKSGKQIGKFLGISDSLNSVSQIISPLIGGFIINHYYPGTIGLVSGTLLILVLFLEVFLNINGKHKHISKRSIST